MKAVAIASFAVLIVCAYQNARGEMPTARAGDRIRIKVERQADHFYGTRTETSGWIYGVLVALSPDSLGLAVEPRAETLVVLRSDIVAADKSIGIETHEDSGHFFGLVAGIVGGVAIGTAIGVKGDNLGAIVIGAPAGAVVGSRIGSRAGSAAGKGMPHEHWEEIQRWPGESFRYSIHH